MPVAAVGVVVAGASVAGAQSAPSLPARTAAQLIVDMQQAVGPGAMTATVQESASLGLPDLPGSGDSASGGPASGSSASGNSAYSLLSGSHTFNIWYADAAHLRVAEPVPLGETDLRRDGSQIWLWDSKAQTATHLVLPSLPRRPAGQHANSEHRPDLGQRPGEWPAGRPPTPQQVARQILAAIGPSTAVSVQRNVTVAGRPAYQLAIAPKDSRSLVGQIRIAIDAARHFPLRVQIIARGASSPAFQIGFTALSLGRPAASNFSFTPPRGAKIKTVNLPSPAMLHPGLLHPGLLHPGTPHSGVLQPRTRGSRAGWSGSLYALPGSGWSGTAPPPGSSVNGGGLFRRDTVGLGYVPDQFAGPGGRPTVMGKGWLAVLVFRGGNFSSGGTPSGIAAPSDLTTTSRGTTVGGTDAITAGIAAGGTAATAAEDTAEKANPVENPGAVESAGSVQLIASPSGGEPSVSGPVGQDPAILRALLRAATPVHGAWGSGRLLRTSLFSVLITSKGTVLVGAVAPSVLYADAATIK